MRNNRIGKTTKRTDLGEHSHKTEGLDAGLTTGRRIKDRNSVWNILLWMSAIAAIAAAVSASGCVPGMKRLSQQLFWPARQAAHGTVKPGQYAPHAPAARPNCGRAHPGRYNQSPVLGVSGAEFDRPATSGRRTQKWEDQKVRVAALDLARSMPSVKKIKICYDAKHDEWWVVLYDHQGMTYELKQYVWERTKDNLEPFLVVNRIPQAKLDEDLHKEEKDRACEAFDPPHPTFSR